MKWLERYQSEKSERTPAKARKTKRDDIDGTPSTPSDLYSPSSDSDIMSPPPVKRNKSRRGLGPLMDQHHKREHSVIHHSLNNRSNEENIPYQDYSYIDENAYAGSLYIHHRGSSVSPLRSRVINVQNYQTPVKNSYRGFDIDGIKPLVENEDDHSHLAQEYASSSVTMTSPISLVVKDSNPQPNNTQVYTLTVSNPETEQIIQEDRHPVQQENKNILSQLLTGNVSSSEICYSNDVNNDSVNLSSEVLNIPLTEPASYDNENTENSNKDLNECLSDSKADTWRMTLPKKKWMREHLNKSTKEDNVNRQSVVVRSPLSNICQNRGIEKQKLMGAVALIQLGSQETFSQPLNLSTTRYSDT